MIERQGLCDEPPAVMKIYGAVVASRMPISAGCETVVPKTSYRQALPRRAAWREPK